MSAMLSYLTSSSSGQRLALFCALWPVVFIPISLWLYFAYDSSNYYIEQGVRQIPTISLSGSRLPSSAVLTYGLHLEGFSLLLFFTAIFREMQAKILRAQTASASTSNSDFCANLTTFGKLVEMSTLLGCKCCFTCAPTSLTFWNRFAFCLGIFAAFCMTIVGSIQLVANETAHGTFAFLMFIAGVLHVLVFYYALSKTCANRPIPQFMRQLSILICVPFNILVLVVAGIVFKSCPAFSCRAFAVDVIVVLEFTTVAGLLIYMASFYDDFTVVSFFNTSQPSQPTVEQLEANDNASTTSSADIFSYLVSPIVTATAT
eukprot:gene9330-10296_t